MVRLSPEEGITPAHAGNTPVRSRYPKIRRDHPRTRGEYSFSRLPGQSSRGSPPHTRGILFFSSFFGPSPGITPAHAGNTGNLQPFQYFRMDHPRTRGEYFENSSTQSFQKGSPPHTRGILYVSVGGVVVAGITPAHAGNTSCMRGRERYRRDHPRTRGEYVLFICVEFNVQGSPPHTRGIPSFSCSGTWFCGITPAHAGNTL